MITSRKNKGTHSAADYPLTRNNTPPPLSPPQSTYVHFSSFLSIILHCSPVTGSPAGGREGGSDLGGRWVDRESRANLVGFFRTAQCAPSSSGRLLGLNSSKSVIWSAVPYAQQVVLIFRQFNNDSGPIRDTAQGLKGVNESWEGLGGS